MLVKLKMKLIYKSFLSFIGFLLIVSFSIGLIYLIFYDKMHKESDVDVNGFLSINYNDGKKFEVEDNKTYTFSVVNGSDDTLYYNVSLNNITAPLSYKLYSDSKELSKGKVKLGDKTIISNISIDANETKKYKIIIKNESDMDAVKGSINVSTVKTVVKTFADTIKDNTKPIDDPLTKPGVSLATTEEGLIKDSDDTGITYYFRGISNNNYVSFADKTWRIVRINGDNTVRMVLDGVTDNVSSMYKDGAFSFDYDNSVIQEYLQTWQSDNLKDYESYLSNNIYCNDTTRDEASVYQAYTRLNVNKIPTFSCLSNKYSGNIGLLSADEVILAGGLPNVANNSYYLYNNTIGSEYFTMTAASGTSTTMNTYMVDTNGALTKDTAGSLFRSVRPVINIIKNVEVSGNGTKFDPYKLVLK